MSAPRSIQTAEQPNFSLHAAGRNVDTSGTVVLRIYVDNLRGSCHGSLLRFWDDSPSLGSMIKIGLRSSPFLKIYIYIKGHSSKIFSKILRNRFGSIFYFTGYSYILYSYIGQLTSMMRKKCEEIFDGGKYSMDVFSPFLSRFDIHKYTIYDNYSYLRKFPLH